MDRYGRGYLGIAGFKSACYYFITHMNEHFYEHKKPIIAQYAPLADSELNLGAFDINRFGSAYEMTGERDFNLIYDAAKYITTRSRHARAMKFADEVLGRMDKQDVEKQIINKRSKELLIAYPMIPIEDKNDIANRYMFLQAILKESKGFGTQRASSEAKAVEMDVKNLAANAGYDDEMPLILRMKTKAAEANASSLRKR